jgi:curved DNA-binding protein CbpA
MSKHVIEINFDQLKFNLYELLNVSSDVTEKQIKKTYRKLIIKFHPDKNNIIDEDIYNHLTLANQILTNTETREKYDIWLKSFGEDGISHDNLKTNFENSSSQLKMHFPSMPTEAKQLYHEKTDKLNIKHGLNNNWDDESTLSRYERKRVELDNIIQVSGERITSKDNFKNEFNNKFNDFKIDNKNQQIMMSDSNQQIAEYNGQLVGNECLSITSYDLLYSEDSIQTNNYSSLDRAFMLQPKIIFDEKDVGDKMKEYNNLSSDLSNLYPKPK